MRAGDFIRNGAEALEEESLDGGAEPIRVLTPDGEYLNVCELMFDPGEGHFVITTEAVRSNIYNNEPRRKSG